MVLWVVPGCWCGSFDDEYARLMAQLADAGVVDDAGVDAGFDAGVDAGQDAGLDAGTDAGVDAGLDAGADAGVDAGSASSDAGDGGDSFDAGTCHVEGESCPCCVTYCCGQFGSTTRCQLEVTAMVPCID